MVSIYDILSEYQPDNSLFSTEDEKINRIKNIIYTDLDEVDRRIILMYAELQSLRKLGKELDISVSSAWIKVKEIQQKIYDKLTADNDDDSVRN